MIAALSACGGSNSKDSAHGSSETTDLDPECREFLAGYEKYVDDYIELLEDYKSNPTDMGLMQRATSMAAESNSWASKAPDCKNATSFLATQAKIQAKLTKASLIM